MTQLSLKEMRKKSGLTAKEAAEQSGTPYGTWLSWENDKRRTPGIAFEWMKLYRRVNG